MYTQFFGNYLLANGYVTRDQLFSAMRQEADQHMKLGTLALHAGYMNCLLYTSPSPRDTR